MSYPELNHYQLSRYIIERVNSHASLYANRITAFKLEASEAMLFRVLHFGLMVQLDEGHTVLRLSDKHWQEEILAVSVGLIEAWLNVDMRQIFEVMDGTPPEGLPRLMSGYGQTLKTNMDMLGITGRQARLLFDVVMDVARFYWFCRDKDLSQFCHALMTHPLFEGFIVNTQLIDNTQQNLKSTPVITPQKPIVLQMADSHQHRHAYIWLQRAWCAEFYLASHVARLVHAGQEADSDAFAHLSLDDSLKTEQKNAIITALSHPFVLITGGPGTGKTHTVAHLVMALSGMGQMGSLALAAPTGKAAQRMQESLQNALRGNQRISLPESKTIHRLLGIGTNGKPRHDKDNPLAEDIIIVDEASMLGVELACQLFAAIKTGARLILLGDANQLAAVEAGAVLADLCNTPALSPYHVALKESRRFADDSGVGQLALAVQNKQQAETVLAVMDDFDETNFVDISQLKTDTLYQALGEGFVDYMNATLRMSDLAMSNDSAEDTNNQYTLDVSAIFAIFNEYRILCASHLGEVGDVAINAYLEKMHRKLHQMASATTQSQNRLSSHGQWYHGRPVMIQYNDYELGLFNGDVGICLGEREPKVYFEHKPQGINVALLGDEFAVTAYAITVHKSQGSEFDNVAIAFDEDNERLLSKELLYTAITRAKSALSIYSSPQALQAAITTPTVRNTGLDLHFLTQLSSC